MNGFKACPPIMRRAHGAVKPPSVVVETFRNGVIQKSRQTVAVGIWPVGLWRIASRPNQDANGGTKPGFTDIRIKEILLVSLLVMCSMHSPAKIKSL